MSRQSNSAPSSGADGRSVLDAPTPQRIRDEPDEGPVAAIPDTEEGDRDPDAPNVSNLHPSALGLTVHVDGSVDELRVRRS